MYVGAASMFVVAVLGVVGLIQLHRLTGVSRMPIESLPFLSGSIPTEHALSRYHVRWYIATLIFLAFDIEMLFMYPWALVVAQVGASAVLEMFVFLAALLVAVLWAWREGALRWV